MKRQSTHAFSLVIARFGILALIFFSIILSNAQTIRIDSSSIRELMYEPDQKTIQLPIWNDSEDTTLIYQASIEYKRTPKEIAVQSLFLLEEIEDSLYNTFLQYVNPSFLSAAYGNPDHSPLTVATRFKAGANGFNLSNVGTWFIPGNLASGTIQVEIRAGGSSIQDAMIVSQGSVQYETKQNELNGQMFNIELKNEIALYPEEDFYVLFTYPGEIARPQGCAVNNTVDLVGGRYWVKINDTFADLQQMESYANGAWLMYAAEKSPDNIGWLSFTQNASDSVLKGDSTFIRLQLNGLITDSGSQYADVVILSNDTLNPEVRVTVELRLNEAPYFLEAPSDILIAENTSSEINIILKDLEGDEFSLTPVMGCKFVQFSMSDSILNLSISPKQGDAGDYIIRFVATDKYGLSRELMIPIHVLANQPPVFIDPPTTVSVTETTTLELVISAYDPEGDDFQIHLLDSCNFITSSFNPPELRLRFTPQAGDAGEYIIRLLATDEYGVSGELMIPLQVLTNQPPVFIDLPTIVSVTETTALELVISAYDPENNDFEIHLLDSCDFITSAFNSPELWLRFTPQRGDAGEYTIRLLATDEYGMSGEWMITIQVLAGQPLVFIDPPTEISVTETTALELVISAYDPENNDFEIHLLDSCDFITSAFSHPELILRFTPQRGDAGEYPIRLLATDEYGVSGELTIWVLVLPNQPPVFIDPPTTVSVTETTSLELVISAYDPEDNDFEIQLIDSCDFITSSFNPPELILQLNPQRGDAGEYTLRVQAQDDIRSVSELLIPLHVLPRNRPPVYIGDGSPITFSFMAGPATFDINDYFMDMENDPFTFEIVCRNSNVVDVTTDGETYFTLQAKSVGSTVLDFTLVDAQDEQAQYTMEVIVGLCEKPDGIIVQKWNKVLLVNNYLGQYAPDGYQWYKNGIPIQDATRQDYSSEEDTGELLDLTAEYFVRIIRITGDTIYTCPYTPLRKSGTLSVYPNPVMRSGSLHIEYGSDIPETVMWMDTSGRIGKMVPVGKDIPTVSAPDIPGIYILRIVSKNSENVFRIQVY